MSHYLGVWYRIVATLTFMYNFLEVILGLSMQHESYGQYQITELVCKFSLYFGIKVDLVYDHMVEAIDGIRRSVYYKEGDRRVYFCYLEDGQEYDCNDNVYYYGLLNQPLAEFVARIYESPFVLSQNYLRPSRLLHKLFYFVAVYKNPFNLVLSSIFAPIVTMFLNDVSLQSVLISKIFSRLPKKDLVRLILVIRHLVNSYRTEFKYAFPVLKVLIFSLKNINLPAAPELDNYLDPAIAIMERSDIFSESRMRFINSIPEPNAHTVTDMGLFGKTENNMRPYPDVAVRYYF